MLDGFNEGWITFEHDTRKGRVDLDAVLRTLIVRSRKRRQQTSGELKRTTP
jgi:hypothetical protein